jgi:hypothetical protein
MDFVRAILLQKPVAKAEEHNREAHQQRDRHHIGCARVSTDDQPIHLLLVVTFKITCRFFKFIWSYALMIIAPT